MKRYRSIGIRLLIILLQLPVVLFSQLPEDKTFDQIKVNRGDTCNIPLLSRVYKPRTFSKDNLCYARIPITPSYGTSAHLDTSYIK